MQRLCERVMARHRMLLAAFLMQPDRPSGTARPEILVPAARFSLGAKIVGSR
jgi:hypothetical protein